MYILFFFFRGKEIGIEALRNIYLNVTPSARVELLTILCENIIG